MLTPIASAPRISSGVAVGTCVALANVTGSASHWPGVEEGEGLYAANGGPVRWRVSLRCCKSWIGRRNPLCSARLRIGVVIAPTKQAPEEPSDIEGNECCEIVGPEFCSFRLPDG